MVRDRVIMCRLQSKLFIGAAFAKYNTCNVQLQLYSESDQIMWSLKFPSRTAFCQSQTESYVVKILRLAGAHVFL